MLALVEEHIVEVAIEKDVKKNVPVLSLPKDKYFFCHLVFFLIGITHILPTILFVNINPFWMYKFRNLSDPTMSSENRTSLQIYFPSTQLIAGTIPILFVGLANIFYGHKLRILSRVICSLIVQLIIVLFLAVSTKIQTDNYQLMFFILVTMFWTILSGASTMNLFSSTLLYSRFPISYMQTCLYGESVASIIGDILNISTVLLFDDIESSTLMFSAISTGLISLTLCLSLGLSKSKFFRHYLRTLPENKTVVTPSRKDIFEIFFKIRVAIFMFLMISLGLAGSTAITPLVVSEQYRDSTKWAKKFFTPVLTFFCADFSSLVGRFLATKAPMKNLGDNGLCALATALCILVVPLVWFCNAQPRHHLTVLFEHDYQYAIIIAALQILVGYLINMGLFLISTKTTEAESDMAFNIFNLIYGIITMSTSSLGLVIVKIL